MIGDNGAVTFSIQGHPDSPGGLYTTGPSGFSFGAGDRIPTGPGYGPPYKNAIMMLQDLQINNGPIASTAINFLQLELTLVGRL